MAQPRVQPDFQTILCRDRYRLTQQYQHLKSTPNSANEHEERKKWQVAYDKSQQTYQTHLLNLPQVEGIGVTASDLPIAERWDEIREHIASQQVVIVSGHTGSGKTTQIPQICLQLKLGVRGKIAHTQPRRVAARAVAQRLAEELNVNVGDSIGYKMRFEEKQSAKTRVLLMTDGMLLADIQKDPYLSNYEVIIIDEAHERSLNIDFLLGYLKTILPKRPDLKIIITSATIDTATFSKHFAGAPVIEVAGKTYPIETLYQPLDKDEDLFAGVQRALSHLERIHPGDTLIFLPTERDIRDIGEELSKQLASQKGIQTEVLSLFARQNSAKQQAIFHPGAKRRIILTTNVAETSLTVPRIRNVIDSGLARISRYSPRSKIQRLPIEAISQASANQRQGRCGRISAGMCIRLYSEEDFTQRPAYTDAEILRTSLAAVILQMSAMRLGQIEHFPFVVAPDSRLINDGYKLLFELGAVDERQVLTTIGKQMARLPVDPRFGKILLEAKAKHLLPQVLPIVAAVVIGDVRERQPDKTNQADEKQRIFVDKRSDFLFYVNLFQTLYPLYLKSKSQSRRFASQHFLSVMRTREWLYLVEQLADLLDYRLPDINTTTEPLDAGAYAILHQCLLSGFLDQVGVYQSERGDYLGTRNRRFYVFPGSGLAKRKAPQVMFMELVESSRVFIRLVAEIDLTWLFPLAKHLLRSREYEPAWRRRAGNVLAKQDWLLYGLPIVTGKTIPVANYDLAEAHQIFVTQALVENAIDTPIRAIGENRNRYLAALDLEERSRSRGIVIDERRFAELYFAVLPESVFSTVTLAQWVKEHAEEKGEQRGALLKFTDDCFYLDAESPVKQAGQNWQDYPNELLCRHQRLPLRYVFDPSREDDGVTVRIPLANLNVFQSIDFDYLVPALLADKITALIRSLPKRYRRVLVPIAPVAEKVVAHVQTQLTQQAAPASAQPLLKQIIEALWQQVGLTLHEADFDCSKIDKHFLMAFEIIDAEGKVVDSGRNLSALQAKWAQAASQAFTQSFTQQSSATIAKPAKKVGKTPNPSPSFIADPPIQVDAPELSLSVVGANHVDLAARYQREFPEQIPMQIQFSSEHQKGMLAFCALVPEQVIKTPSLRDFKIALFDQSALAEAAHRQGVNLFFQQALGKEGKYLSKNIVQIQQLSLWYRLVQDKTDHAKLLEDLITASVAILAFTPDVPRDRASYASRLQQMQGQFIAHTQQLADTVGQALQNLQQIRSQLDPKKPWYKDITQQLERWFFAGFIGQTEAVQLKELIRYSKGILVRLQKAPSDPAKDQARQAEVAVFENQLQDYLNKRNLQTVLSEATFADSTQVLRQFCYLLEEYRLSLFAQTEVGCKQKVSAKRLETAWAAVLATR